MHLLEASKTGIVIHREQKDPDVACIGFHNTNLCKVTPYIRVYIERGRRVGGYLDGKFLC